jgi:hypothetical protein
MVPPPLHPGPQQRLHFWLRGEAAELGDEQVPGRRGTMPTVQECDPALNAAAGHQVIVRLKHLRGPRSAQQLEVP